MTLPVYDATRMLHHHHQRHKLPDLWLEINYFLLHWSNLFSCTRQELVQERMALLVILCTKRDRHESLEEKCQFFLITISRDVFPRSYSPPYKEFDQTDVAYHQFDREGSQYIHNITFFYLLRWDGVERIATMRGWDAWESFPRVVIKRNRNQQPGSSFCCFGDRCFSISSHPQSKRLF